MLEASITFTIRSHYNISAVFGNPDVSLKKPTFAIASWVYMMYDGRYHEYRFCNKHVLCSVIQ